MDQIATLATAELTEAVAQQVQADSHVALALSSGVDSTLLAHLSRRSARPRCYSVTFGWGGRDEAEFAAKTAAALDLEFRELAISLPDYRQLLLRGATQGSEPIADWTGPAYLALASACRADGVKVLLTGHGPDEVMWGYPWARRALSEGTSRATGHLDAYQWNPEFRAVSALSAQVYGEMLQPALSNRMRHFPELVGGSYEDAFRSFLISGYLRSNGLAQLDSLGMTCGVEIRVPYVDYRFVEAVLSGRSLPGKLLLERIARAVVPNITFRGKRPFYPPIEDIWPQLLPIAIEMIPEGHLVRAGMIDRLAVEGLFSRGVAGASSTFLFRILIFELWLSSLTSPQGGALLARCRT